MIQIEDLWDSAIKFAENHRDSEFHIRASIGRLFYAAYHGVAELVGHPEVGDQGHLRLVQAARASNDKHIRRLAGHLDELRRRRQASDYRLSLTLTQVDLDEMCSKAKNIRTCLACSRSTRENEAASSSRSLTPPTS